MNIYEDIAKRTSGEIYIGVVGPVRCGKSTLIKKFMEGVIIPSIESDYDRGKATDVTPQCASGKSVMTTEPKFIPDEAVGVKFGEARMKVRLIDCVGYMIDGALDGSENGEKRMVTTPWSSEPMEFDKAGELGTRKVISEHSTIGIVVTSDGSFGEFSRDDYIGAERRVVSELKELGKPFVIVLNSARPESREAINLAMSIEEKYSAPVALVNANELTSEDFEGIMRLLLGQFEANEVVFHLPKYLSCLDSEHWLKSSIIESIKESIKDVKKIDDIDSCAEILGKNEHLADTPSHICDLGTGNIDVKISLQDELYYKIISELCDEEIGDDEALFFTIRSLSEAKRELDKFAKAIDEVHATGYGIVPPCVEDMILEEPQIVKHSSAYGVKLRACAPSIHMIRAQIETEINPMVGTQEQSQEIVQFMLEEIEDDPKKIWESKMFGKSLYELVNEGLHSKLEHITQESRTRLCDTLSRVINEGSSGLICIIL